MQPPTGSSSDKIIIEQTLQISTDGAIENISLAYDMQNMQIPDML